MHAALCRPTDTTLDVLHVERRAADHSANMGSSAPTILSILSGVGWLARQFERRRPIDFSVDASHVLAEMANDGADRRFGTALGSYNYNLQ